MGHVVPAPSFDDARWGLGLNRAASPTLHAAALLATNLYLAERARPAAPPKEPWQA